MLRPYKKPEREKMPFSAYLTRPYSSLGRPFKVSLYLQAWSLDNNWGYTMKEGNFVGVDVSKKDFHTALTISGKWINSKFSNNKAGYEKFVSWMKSYGAVSWVCLEATGIYGEGVASYLHNLGIQVSVVNPMQIKHYSKLCLSRNKNDIVDARIIAEYAEKMPLTAYKPRTMNQKEATETGNLIRMLKGQRNQLSNQLDTVSSENIKEQISEQIKAIDKRISALESSLESLVKSDPVSEKNQQRLVSIKGIANKSANHILAYLPDVEQFERAKQLVAYIGLNPRQHSSGTYQGKTRLSKCGDPHLRKLLYMPALVAKNKNPHFQAFCSRLEKKGLSPKQIICALMRKLVHIIFGMLKHQQDFNPELV